MRLIMTKYMKIGDKTVIFLQKQKSLHPITCNKVKTEMNKTRRSFIHFYRDKIKN